MYYSNLYYSNLEKNGYNVVKIPKYLFEFLKEGVLFYNDTVHYANMNTTSDYRISVEFNILAK